MAGTLPVQIQKLLDVIEKENKEIVDTVKNPMKAKLGYMYLMTYSPKWSAQLPFYDVLPLFVLIGKSGDRFLGLNLHYLPFLFRVNLARKLMKMTSWKKRIQYKDVVEAIRSAKVPEGLLYLCIRSYLYSHIRSEIKEFHSQNFEMAIQEVMPRFKKETETQIYKILMSKFYKKIGGLNPKKK